MTAEETNNEQGLDPGLCDALPVGRPKTILAIILTKRQPAMDHSILVDLSESLVASQSDLNPYCQRGVSRKRYRLVLTDLCQDEGSSEEELAGDVLPAQPAQPADTGYDSYDSENIDTGFVRHRESNLANWLGLRLPWAGLRLETIRTTRASTIDNSRGYRDAAGRGTIGEAWGGQKG